MAEDTNPHPSFRQEFPDRGNRPGHQRDGGHREGGPRDGGQRDGGQRDAGGFRIRLSDNEMQAARALQEAFGLRSTVAVLGFALRTLAQQLEEGQLGELVARQRAQGNARGPAPQGGDRRRERPEGGEPRGARTQRVDPFARPGRPAVVAPPAAAEAAPGGEAGEVVAEGPEQAAPDGEGGAAVQEAAPAAVEGTPEATPGEAVRDEVAEA